MDTTTLKMDLLLREFFSINPKKIVIEDVPETGRTYFLHQGRIVAAARQEPIA